MMITSYILGQKFYPVPYAKKKLLAYLVLVALIYGVHRGLVHVWDNRWFNIGSATFLLLLFAIFVSRIERKELERLPLVGKFFK
jgi:hypothetical protein